MGHLRSINNSMAFNIFYLTFQAQVLYYIAVKYELRTRGSGITWELVRSVESQAPSQTQWIIIFTLTRFPGMLHAH